MHVVHLLLFAVVTFVSVIGLGPQVDSALNSIEHGDFAIQTYYSDERGAIPSGESRARRQLFFKKKKKKNNRFLSALNRLVLDTVNDTSIAYRNISMILADQFGGAQNQTNGNATMSASNSTTPMFNMQQLFDLLGRNYRGLVKLFNREFRTAITDSNRNVERYRKEFRDALRPFFQPTLNTTVPNTT